MVSCQVAQGHAVSAVAQPGSWPGHQDLEPVLPSAQQCFCSGHLGSKTTWGVFLFKPLSLAIKWRWGWRQPPSPLGLDSQRLSTLEVGVHLHTPGKDCPREEDEHERGQHPIPSGSLGLNVTFHTGKR